jgi:glucose-6-phosphate dehydrogenase assembly protein OpcA
MATFDISHVLDELAQQHGTEVSTTSLNVVVFAEKHDDFLQRAIQRIDELSGRHASRTIVLVAADDPQTRLAEAERVEIGIRGVAANEVRSIVHDLTVPDVRTVLMWGGSDLSEEHFIQLGELANVVILFSSARDRGVEPLRQILQQRNSPVGGKLRDLAYMRLLTWQDTVAQFFDDDDLASELPTISRISVVSGTEPEAYYLVGWLASRLKWDPCGAREFCNPQGRVVTVEMQKSGPVRRVQSVRLESSHCTFGATIESGSEDLICLTVDGEKARPRRCTPLHDVDIISLVERAIFSPQTDVYGATLDMVGRLLQQSEG